MRLQVVHPLCFYLIVMLLGSLVALVGLCLIVVILQTSNSGLRLMLLLVRL